MPESNQTSTMTWLWPLILSMPLPSLLTLNGYAETTYVSVDLMVTGGGILASGILLLFVVLPRTAAYSEENPDRAIAWQNALARPFAVLGALIAGLGAVLLAVPSDARSIDITWAIFCALILIDLGIIMARAIRVFSVRHNKE
jgi:hypothetical protein